MFSLMAKLEASVKVPNMDRLPPDYQLSHLGSLGINPYQIVHHFSAWWSDT